MDGLRSIGFGRSEDLLTNCLEALDFAGVADTQAIFALEIPLISLKSRPLHLPGCVCLPK